MYISQQIKNITKTLEDLYPNPKPTLTWDSPFEALIAVMLSAQCTDEKVNKVTKILFAKANTAEKIVSLGVDSLREIIKPCGLHNSKSKNIIATSKALIEKPFPQTFKELTALPGVGEKTAQVILAQVIGTPAFPVDTHIYRIANRLGICKTRSAPQTSACLKKKIPKKLWRDLHLQMIFHGRETCQARKPRCAKCPLQEVCSFDHKNLE